MFSWSMTSGYLQTVGSGVYDGLHQVTNVNCLAFARVGSRILKVSRQR